MAAARRSRPAASCCRVRRQGGVRGRRQAKQGFRIGAIAKSSEGAALAPSPSQASAPRPRAPPSQARVLCRWAPPSQARVPCRRAPGFVARRRRRTGGGRPADRARCRGRPWVGEFRWRAPMWETCPARGARRVGGNGGGAESGVSCGGFPYPHPVPGVGRLRPSCAPGVGGAGNTGGPSHLEGPPRTARCPRVVHA